MGELFGIGQSQANEWIHTLLPILKQALDDLGYEPERDPKKFKKSEQGQKDASQSIIDGTERRRQRPKEAKKQALHYSGKKKTHSDKNVVIATVKKNEFLFWAKPTRVKTHDKKAAETEKIRYPEDMTLLKDTGFQGYEPKVYKTIQPKKSRARKSWPRRKRQTIAKYPRCVSELNMRLRASNVRDASRMSYAIRRMVFPISSWSLLVVYTTFE